MQHQWGTRHIITRVAFIHSCVFVSFSYYTHDGLFDASPAAARAVDETISALKKAGHTCTPFKPPTMDQVARLYYSIMAADGGKGLVDGMEGEAPNKMYNKMLNMAKVLKLPREKLMIDECVIATCSHCSVSIVSFPM